MNASNIILATLNARYSHTSLALRCLMANLGELQVQTRILELVIGIKTEAAVEKLLAGHPEIIAFSVYIWNVEETTKIVQLLRLVAPDVKVVLGGPEVSHEAEGQVICQLADHVISGPGELAFKKLCHQLLEGPRPLMKYMPGDTSSVDHLGKLQSPYPFYTDLDIAHRLTYVEASRGCPFKCEFCLSALDKTAWPFDLQRTLADLEGLYQRGARTFKFIDRTFNLKVDNSLAILDFFLTKQDVEDPVFAHFEVIPDHLPAALREMIARFPAAALQFEMGIQTLNPLVQARISRRQDNTKARENIRWLGMNTHVHMHLDLIAGLPGEDLDSFATGFNQLVDWLGLGRGAHHEIQLGILKRLRGTPIIRHTLAYGLTFNPNPPYNVLSTSSLDFPTMRRVERFARYWELVANRELGTQREQGIQPPEYSLADPQGLLSKLLNGSTEDIQTPFERFMSFSDWLYENTDTTFRIERQRLTRLVQEWLASH